MTKSAPSTTIVSDPDPGAAGARAQLPVAGADDARRRPELHQQVLAGEVRRPRRPAQWLHHASSTAATSTTPSGAIRGEREPGRGAGVQGVPQPVRRPVRRGAGRGGHGGDPSGTNDFEGTGFFFGRDDSLNARNAFQQSKPVYEQQRTGASLGGPIFRNKTHFFGAYEYNHVANQKIIALPASNPFATRENGEFPAGSREHMFVTKWNHRFTDNNSAFLRYAFDDQWATRTGNPSSDSANVNDSSKMHSLIGEQNWVLSNTTVNTLRGHYMWNEVATLPVSFGPGEVRPSVTTGQNFTAPQYFPRTRLQLFETLFMTKRPPRPQDGRRLHLRPAHLRRPLLRERAVAVRHRRGVQLGRTRRPGRSPS